ncbi:MAG: extracellular solute-binding protein, partial [Acinetobacter sp.]
MVSANAALLEPVEEFTIDWYVDLSWWGWSGLGFGDDLTSQILKEKTGATINFITPATDGGEQLSTMIASDTLPDVITLPGLWDSNARMLAYQMSQEGYLLSLNELIEKFNPDMSEVIRKDVFDWYAENDGKTYMTPNYAYSSDDLKPGEQLVPNRCITVHKDLWEAIGSPDMSTPEGFLAACEKAKTELETYDGKEIIPLQLYEGANEALSIMNQYFAVPFEDESGKYVYDLDVEGTRESLAFLNEAYRRNLITESNFSDTRDMINEKVASGRVFAMITAPQDFIQQMGSLFDADNKAVYMPVNLHNSKGDDPVLSDIRGWGWLMTGVTSKAERPDLIINLFEYLMSDEGQIDMCYGKEGVTFQYNEDGTISLTEQYYADSANNDVKKYGLAAMTLLDNYAFRRKFDSVPTDAKTLATNDVLVKASMTPYSYDYSANGLKLDPADPRQEEIQES